MTANNVTIKCPEVPRKVILANFSNGHVNNEKELETYFYGSKSETPGKKDKKLLVSETKRMSYIGNNSSEHHRKINTLSNYYVGVYDKSKNKLEIAEADIFHMYPNIPGFSQSEGNETLPSKSYKDRMESLVEAFGHKKVKKSLEAKRRNKMDKQDLSLSLTTAAANANTSLAIPGEEQDEDYLPRCNKDAERAQDVYSIDDIISVEEASALESVAEIFENRTFDDIQKWKKEDVYPSYILNRLRILPMEEKQRRKKSKYLMYLSFLLEFYKIKQNKLQGRDPLPQEWPNEIKKSILQKYTLKVEGSKSRLRPARLKDKLLLNMLILCLTIDEFELEMTDLIHDLQLTTIVLQGHFRVLGCQIKSKKLQLADEPAIDVQMALLKVPLTFPDQKRRKRSNRRL